MVTHWKLSGCRPQLLFKKFVYLPFKPCAQQRSAYGSAQSDHYPPKDIGPWLPYTQSVLRRLIRWCWCAGWSVFAGRTCNVVESVMPRLVCYHIYNISSFKHAGILVISLIQCLQDYNIILLCWKRSPNPLGRPLYLTHTWEFGILSSH